MAEGEQIRDDWIKALREAALLLRPTYAGGANRSGSLHTLPVVLDHLADNLQRLMNGEQHPALLPEKKQGSRRDLQDTAKATVAGWAQHLIDYHKLAKSNAVDQLACWFGLEQGSSDAQGKPGKTISVWLKVYQNHASPELRRAFGVASQGRVLADLMAKQFTPRSLKDFELAVMLEWRAMQST